MKLFLAILMSATALRAAQVHEARALLAQGLKQTQVAARLGLTPPTLCRMLQAYEAEGEAGLAKKHATGPREDHVLTADEQSALKLGMLRKRSRRQAAEFLMDHDACTEGTFDRLAAIFDRAAAARADEVWPAWFRRATIVTQEETASFLGPKHLARVEPARPRGLFYVDEVGEHRSLFPNALWEFDDESENTPRVEFDENGKPRVNRQTLKAIDYAASFYLGMKQIDRDSDGYRLEDQADFLLELVDAHGLPHAVRIERGPWDNNFWFGIAQKREWWYSKDCPDYRFGGIDLSAGGPVRVMQAFKSRHKGLVEGSFNHRQNLAAHETLDIGRERGEHEAAAKLLTQVQNLKDPQKLARAIAHFPTAQARADISGAVLDRFNHEAKRRRHVWGPKKLVPAEVYATAVKRPLPATERWRCLPVKVTTTIRNAHVQVKVPKHEFPFLFSAEGFTPQWDWHNYLPHGWRLFVAFHPLRLDLGCHVFNALHADHPENPGRFPLGMPLGVLPHAARAPQWREDGEGDFAGRKRTLSAIRSETRITRAAKKGVRVSTVVAAGQVRSTRHGSPDPLRALPAPVVCDAEALYACGAEPVADEVYPRRGVAVPSLRSVTLPTDEDLAEAEAAILGL